MGTTMAGVDQPSEGREDRRSMLGIPSKARRAPHEFVENRDALDEQRLGLIAGAHPGKLAHWLDESEFPWSLSSSAHRERLA
jgi:hypothetical protein